MTKICVTVRISGSFPKQVCKLLQILEGYFLQPAQTDVQVMQVISRHFRTGSSGMPARSDDAMSRLMMYCAAQRSHRTLWCMGTNTSAHDIACAVGYNVMLHTSAAEQWPC